MSPGRDHCTAGLMRGDYDYRTIDIALINAGNLQEANFSLAKTFNEH